MKGKDFPPEIGPYTISRRIGAGGVGEVYLGICDNGPEVAIKVLRHEGSSAIKRFEREARLLALLYHPLIVGILDQDLLNDPPWFSMDYVPGKSLNRLIAKRERSNKGFTVEEIVKVGHDMAQALAAAHSVGVYHRDIKPANLLVDKVFDVHLVDFGLARDMGSLEKLTQDGSFLGTMSYCAPEQFKGLRGDSRTDVYQTGLVLYELCTLHLPFDDKDGIAPVVLRCQGQAIPPPSHANPDIPPMLEKIIFRCLHVDASRRYPTAKELLDDILGLPVDFRTQVDVPESQMLFSKDGKSSDRPSSSSSTLASSIGRLPEDLPAVIDGHEIMGTLGEGGMGRVFLVRKNECEMAMKVLSLGGSAKRNALLRFRREIEVLSELTHPNVVRIFDHGSHEGFEWFTMEYVSANSLRGLLDLTQALTPHKAVHIASSIAAALAFCHPKKIFHRDIKPDNILVDVQGRVKLTDFGLALPTDATSLTRTGEMLGTFAYLTPEMLTGEQVGPGSDLFQVGLVLYEMLTGEFFFKGIDLMARRRGVMADVCLPAFMAKEVSDPLAKVINRCLQIDPKKRYLDASALLKELRVLENLFAGERGKRKSKSKSKRKNRMGSLASPSSKNKSLASLSSKSLASPSSKSLALLSAKIAYKVVVGFFVALLILVSILVIVYLPQMRIGQAGQ